MKQCLERLYNGVIKENPTFVLMLGMCPTLAVTVSAINGFGMGISTMAVLAMSNLLISLLRKMIPDKVRIPIYIVIVATFVTIVELLMHAFVPSLYESLGIYISLIVVNCIILGRAEAYASQNKPLPSLFDGIGMGLGFTLALTIIGFVRELVGTGKAFGVSVESICGSSLATLGAEMIGKILPANSESQFISAIGSFLGNEVQSASPILIFALAPGAFFVLAILTAIQNKVKMNLTAKGKDASKIQSGCNSDCMNCSDKGCSRRLINEEGETSDTNNSKQDEFGQTVSDRSGIEVLELDDIAPDREEKKKPVKPVKTDKSEQAIIINKPAKPVKSAEVEKSIKIDNTADSDKKVKTKKAAKVEKPTEDNEEAEVETEDTSKKATKPRKITRVEQPAKDEETINSDKPATSAKPKKSVKSKQLAEPIVEDKTSVDVEVKPVRKPRAKKADTVENSQQIQEKKERKPRVKKESVKEENADE